jgi:mRNA capping enzyme
MRNLNNWVKGQLIERAFDFCPSSSYSKKTGLSVLDFCCGKGGDLFKWIKSQKGGEQIFTTCCRVCVCAYRRLLDDISTYYILSH